MPRARAAMGFDAGAPPLAQRQAGVLVTHEPSEILPERLAA
ncbi:MAG: hypothetical protein AAGB48_00935 [Planctomycetota bacterium]